jgi:hypothetical protein
MLKKTSAALSLSLALVAQTSAPKDVNGWGKLKWGMSLAEAKAITPQHVTVDQFELTITLYPSHSDSKKLGKIDLDRLLNDDPAGTYNSLKTLLIQKYGQPTNQERQDSGGKTRNTTVWIFPSTIITLDTYGTEGVEILYEPSNAKTADAL